MAVDGSLLPSLLRFLFPSSPRTDLIHLRFEPLIIDARVHVSKLNYSCPSTPPPPPPGSRVGGYDGVYKDFVLYESYADT